MSDIALYDKGLPIRREVRGPASVDAPISNAGDFMFAFRRAAARCACSDPTLDRNTRSLANPVMPPALNRTPEIKLHMKGAPNNGVMVDQLQIVLLHATADCDIPAGPDALSAAHDVLVKEGALLGKPPG